jgi:hypothetical protein
MIKKIEHTKLYLGPMTKNIVDGVIEYNDFKSVGLIASRRQIDSKSGYVNDWTTSTFVKYVKSKNNDILVCRDHGGVYQGRFYDNGTDSLTFDAINGMDIIHIDPWKAKNIDYCIGYTIFIIDKCMKQSKTCLFEVGTEQSIYEMTASDLDYFLDMLKHNLGNEFSRIVYAVIQSGTSLKAGENTGNYDEERLKDMLEVCDKYGIFSKEHNGDYLDPKAIKNKFSLGLTAINIAPEVAHIETNIILDNIDNVGIESWFNLCIEDGQWAKWFDDDFVAEENKIEVLSLCGHYVLSHCEFSKIFDLDSISTEVIKNICAFLEERNI